MINKHIVDIIKGKFGHVPTASQEQAIEKFSEFILDEKDQPVLLIKGYAGTGKTSLVSSFVQAIAELNFKQILMAPTGRAAKVFSGYAKHPAHTVHKIIYRQKSANDGFGAFNISKNLKPDTIFFVDEASMIAGFSGEYSSFGTGNLLEDLLNFVFEGNNCRLVLIGDSAQLPPVGNSESPALDKDTLAYYSTTVTECFLSDVVRQSDESGILSCSSDLRFDIESSDIFDDLPKLDVEHYSDVNRLTGEELIEAINVSYDTVGMDETLIVNRSNKRTNLYNKGIRASVLYKEEELTVGDILLVVKNNYHWLKNNKEVDFIANGDIAEVVRIRGYEELYGRRFVNCVIRLVDYRELEVDVKLMMDALSLDTPGLSQKEQETFFYEVMEDYAELSPKRKQYEAVKNNEYYNALQVKFAYAMTCHKAQGGQWKNVFVDPGFVPDENINRDYYRWLYTAFTRCTEKLYLVNFKDEYFE
ncbi:ATP-dependent DNA helicase [Labilibacter marinus]|uniref:ATP-dependent DNA helicase n=1 Tax=Labilibacter marinus TaxID=1477105 RepID=UPI0008342129|nr:AAA family ATPase [Labilibacter marinus]